MMDALPAQVWLIIVVQMLGVAAAAGSVWAKLLNIEKDINKLSEHYEKHAILENRVTRLEALNQATHPHEGRA